MANTYDPASVGVKAPAGGFQEGGWYGGRQFWGGTLSDAGVIHPGSNQQGAGQAVSAEVNAQSAAAQGVKPQDFNQYLVDQNKKAAGAPVATRADYSQAGMTKGSNIPGLPSGGAGVPGVQPIDLTATYRKLTEDSGIRAKEDELAALDRSFTETKGKINDNPYLSEATRVGREAKLQQLHDERTANIRNEIATKKADVDMLLNLQTKQFDINSQAAQLALQQFNQLLDAGALDGASPEDLANITRSTGLSSSLIQAAANAKKVSGYNTSTQTFDDGTNEGFVIYTVDPMGNIVNQVKQITGTSKKSNSAYSSDPFVSSFLKDILGGVAETKTGIQDLWSSTGGSKTSSSNQVFSYVG